MRLFKLTALFPYLVAAFPVFGEALAVLHDGRPDEWAGIAVHAADSIGDTSGEGADFVSLKVANDDEALYLLLTLAGETLLQETDTSRLGSRITLYLDGDANPSTGRSVGGLGAELEIRLGTRSARSYAANGFFTTLSIYEAGYIGLPTHTSETFEIRIPYEVRPDFGNPVVWRTSGNVDFYLQDSISDDRFPDNGTTRYTISPDNISDPEVIPLSRADGTDMRLLIQNVLNTTPQFNPQPFARILNAVQPDIVAWQEVRTDDWDNSDVLQFFNDNYPAPGGRSWSIGRNSDTVTISSWPILNVAPLSGNHVAHIDLPEAVSEQNLILFNAHTPCCNNESGRDFEHDQISATWRNLLNGTGPFSIDSMSTAVMTGDFNMVGFRRQLRTLRDGDLIDNGTWGADFLPGRGNGSLTAVTTRHTHSRRTFTWYNPGSSFGPGRLDWLFYTVDTAAVPRRFVLFTPEIPGPDLAAAGLQSTDSLASDHLPIIVDFDFDQQGGIPADVLLFR